MSDTELDATAYLQLRLQRDGITLDDGEVDRLIALVPVAQDWVRQLSFDETRYAEPVLTHPLT